MGDKRGRPFWGQETVGEAVADQIGAGVEGEFLEYVRAMALHGLHAHAEPVRHLMACVREE